MLFHEAAAVLKGAGVALRQKLPLGLAVCLTVSLMSGAAVPANTYATEVGVQQGSQFGVQAAAITGPELMVTEIHPDVDGADDYEFFEVFNRSDRAIHLNDYTFLYRYTTGSTPDVTFVIPEKTLQPGEPMVFWYNNKSKPIGDFNTKYGVSLTASQLVEVGGSFSGFANGGNRAVVIRDPQGIEIAQATYIGTDVEAGKSIHYKLADSGIEAAKYAIKTAPTPGTAEAAQVAGPSTDVNLPPQITHTPVAATTAGQNLDLSAAIVNPDASVAGSVYRDEQVTAQVYYKLPGAAEFAAVDMAASGTSYEAVLPTASLTGGEQVDYYIQARDTQHTVMTPTYTVQIEPATVDYTQMPRLMVTELVPDSTNVAGKSVDAYEFIEVYNNTNRPVKLSDYELVYSYVSKAGAEVTAVWPLMPGAGQAEIPSQKTVVLWVINADNRGLTAADFNANYGTALAENQQLLRVDGGGGMSNSDPRTVTLRNKAGAIVSTASYQNDDQTKADKGIFYKYPQTGSKDMRMMDNPGTDQATPGSVLSGQVPPVPITTEGQPPVITHTPVAEADYRQDLIVAASVADEEHTQPLNVTLYYKLLNQTKYESIVMTLTGAEAGTYSAAIPKSALTAPLLQYRIEAKNAAYTAMTETYWLPVAQPGAADANAPHLLVTELVPDTTNIEGTSSDGYEFIELYNNTDKDINLKDYKIMYRYTASGPDADIVWPTDREDIVIAAGQAIVFWVINSANTHSTAADFNANYGSQLVENVNLFKMYSDGMANGGGRGVLISTNTHRELSVAYYDTDEETQPNKGIFYKAPVDGTTAMLKYSAGIEAATPGVVDPIQLPASRIALPADEAVPTLTDRTAVSEVNQAHDVRIVADAADNRDVKTVALFYKNNRQSAYTKRYLYESYSDKNYSYTIYSPELIGKACIDYYFTVSDGVNEIVTETTRFQIMGGRDNSELRLNVKEGDILAGDYVLKGTAEHAPFREVALTVDGRELTEGTYAGLESDAYFAFEANSVNYYFKNGVTIGSEILYTFQDPITTYTTLTVPIAAKRLQEGSNVISIRAGSKSSPFDERPEENKDDFEIRNIRLVLADGTEIYDVRYADPQMQIKMGDSSGKFPALDFEFSIPADKLGAKTYALDTRTLPDGAHTLSVSHPQFGEVTASVQVDNTAPTIEATVEDGRMYRGAFMIDALIGDAIAGVSAVAAKLDGASIELPYATASYELAAGTHLIEITATDKAGNTAAQSISFEVPDELPLKPELVSPDNGKTGVGSSANLTVSVADPAGDPLNVEFYRGFKRDAASSRLAFAGYRNSVDVEPPRTRVPTGERVLGEDDYAAIAADDERYLIDDSIEQFPYQRYEISLDRSVKPSDRVLIEWKGKSLEGRKVTLYAWNPADKQWDKLDDDIAGADDFELQASVTAGEYREADRITILIQDEIPPQPERYDYSFVWMSDTQYYAESYPEIYDEIVNWIADNKDEMNIKYVFHTGDIVDEADQAYQWDNANKSMKVLEDANIPYGVLAGNHDVFHQYGSYSYYWQHYGEDRFKHLPHYGGSYKNNMGHYDLISANGNDYIFLYMGWGLGDAEIEWMNEVLAQYPNRMAILSFHEYLLVSGNRAPIADKVFEQVVLPNKNVIATLSGHYHDSELLVDDVDDDGDGRADRKVYQMLADYQGAPKGGLGYIRLMKFDMANNKLYIQTYSPHLDDYNFYEPSEFPGKDEFVLDLNLQPQTKRVATNYVGVKVYTDQKIGQTGPVASGERASVTWTGLQADSVYEWYAQASDEYGGKTVSDIWKFATGEHSDEGSGTGGGTDAETGTGTGGNTGGTKPDGNVAEGGVIASEVSSDGVYRVTAASLQSALQQAESGTVEIRLADVSAEAGSALLQLDGEGLRSIGQQGASLKVAAGGLTLMVPAEAFGDELSGADSVTLRVGLAGDGAAGQGEAAQQIESLIATDVAYASGGIVITLELTVAEDGGARQIRRFAAPITVTVALSGEQAASLDRDFAGVYYLNGDTAEYMGGRLDGSLVVFETEHFSQFAVLEYRKQFADMAQHWADVFVQKLAAKHIAEGVGADLFAPDRAVTRADFAIFAVRALGYADPADAAAKFADVAADTYYAGYVAKAAELGLVEGADGRYRPQDTITREEAAVILMRLHGLQQNGGERAGGGESAAGEFADIGEASPWAAAAIREAQALKLIDGRGDNRFEPHAQLTRAEVAKLLVPMLNRS